MRNKGTREGIDDTDRKDTFMRIEGTTVQTRDREGTDGTSATSTEGTFMRTEGIDSTSATSTGGAFKRSGSTKGRERALTILLREYRGH